MESPGLLPSGPAVKLDPGCLLCTRHAPSLPQGTSEGNAPLTYRPRAETAWVKAARPKGLSCSTWTQKPVSGRSSTEVLPQHCKTQSRCRAFLSAPPNRHSFLRSGRMPTLFISGQTSKTRMRASQGQASVSPRLWCKSLERSQPASVYHPIKM